MTITIEALPWRVGVDVGGTFTDLVVADSEGRTEVFKVPSVPADPGEGVINALTTACEALGQLMEKFLSDCQFFLHGSTVATNTLLEGKGATVGLLTTAGFRDSLEARRGLRKDPSITVPPIRRCWCRAICASPSAVVSMLGGTRSSRSISMTCGRPAKCSAKKALNLSPSACSTVSSTPRMKTPLPTCCAKNSYVTGFPCRPTSCPSWRVRTDVHGGERLRHAPGRVLPDCAATEADRLGAADQAAFMLQSNGGAASLDQLIRQPVNLLSGPSAGVGAMQHLASGIGENNLVSMEIGGTSCDVMLMHEGRVAITDSLSVNDYDLVTPSVDIHTVGAGGGTIAGIDGAGLMYAGPEGAGAARTGGIWIRWHAADRNDAHLVLGRMRPGPMRAARYRSTCRWPSRRWTPKLPHPPGFPARRRRPA